jgi:hypothetical protein
VTNISEPGPYIDTLSESLQCCLQNFIYVLLAQADGYGTLMTLDMWAHPGLKDGESKTWRYVNQAKPRVRSSSMNQVWRYNDATKAYDQSQSRLKAEGRNQALLSWSDSIRPNSRRTQPCPTIMTRLNQAWRQKDATAPYCHDQSQPRVKVTRCSNA